MNKLSVFIIFALGCGVPSTLPDATIPDLSIAEDLNASFDIAPPVDLSRQADLTAAADIAARDLLVADLATRDLLVADLAARDLLVADLAAKDLSVDLAIRDFSVMDLTMSDLRLPDLLGVDLSPQCSAAYGHCNANGGVGPCCSQCCLFPSDICHNNVCVMAYGCNRAEGLVNMGVQPLMQARNSINTPNGQGIFDALITCCAGSMPLGGACGGHNCVAEDLACRNDVP